MSAKGASEVEKAEKELLDEIAEKRKSCEALEAECVRLSGILHAAYDVVFDSVVQKLNDYWIRPRPNGHYPWDWD